MQKNNISYLLTDVKHPSRKKASAFAPTKRRFELAGIGAGRKRESSLRFAAIMIMLVLISCGMAAWEIKENAMGTVLEAYKNFLSAADSAKRYDTEAMGKSLAKAGAGIETIGAYSGILSIIPTFKEMPSIISALKDFNVTAFSVAREAETLKRDAFSLVWNDGDKLISQLENIRSQLRSMTDSFSRIRNGVSSFGLGIFGNDSANYLSLHSEMSDTADLLDGAINLLKGESNLVIFFMNDSEMRATGGFIGSYATVKIRDGEIKDMSVNDIYYPDKFLTEKVVPPTPMMGLTTDWEARDANWFIDFPTSASKVIGFLEKSPVYKDEGITFNGAIAMNHKVVTDILKITGPIELPDYGVVLDQTNFLSEVQKEVSRDSTLRGGERKNILKSLLPEVISRIQKMSVLDKEELVRAANQRLDNKDIQLYFTDKRLENFASKSSWAGEVYQTPASEYGDYLAVSVSNIGGEKTDAYIRQKVTLKSAISASGAISDKLSVKRIHEGDQAKEVFYRAKNQAYIKTLVPRGAKLTGTAGETIKTVVAAINYEKNGYATDGDVKLYEEGIESGKTVFGKWLTVLAGSDKELTMEYEYSGSRFPADGKFRFVYEKQSGVNSMFAYSVQAPPGYVFKETGTSMYEYESTNLPARLIVDLTLQRL
ncbi:MAG: DUF4012 domain-containing protein [Parcubacteria group bacterium]